MLTMTPSTARHASPDSLLHLSQSLSPPLHSYGVKLTQCSILIISFAILVSEAQYFPIPFSPTLLNFVSGDSLSSVMIKTYFPVEICTFTVFFSQFCDTETFLDSILRFTLVALWIRVLFCFQVSYFDVSGFQCVV
jgi:hypothetical protein